MALLPNSCPHAAQTAPSTPPEQRQPDCSRHRPLCFTCLTLLSPPSLRAESLPSFWEVSRSISSASRLPPEVTALCVLHLGPSEHHQWTKMELLINSNSHTKILWGHQLRIGAWLISCYAGLYLVLFRNLPFFSSPLFLEWNDVDVVHERTDSGQAGSIWARQFLGVNIDLDLLFAYLWKKNMPILGVLSFTVNIYFYHLLCLGL